MEEKRSESIKSTVYEVEPIPLPFLREMLDHSGEASLDAGIAFESVIHEDDFILAGRNMIEKTLFTFRQKQPHASCVSKFPPALLLISG